MDNGQEKKDRDAGTGVGSPDKPSAAKADSAPPLFDDKPPAAKTKDKPTDKPPAPKADSVPPPRPMRGVTIHDGVGMGPKPGQIPANKSSRQKVCERLGLRGTVEDARLFAELEQRLELGELTLREDEPPAGRRASMSKV